MDTITHSYLDALNFEQRKAATSMDGPVMVIAGPGSGKTRVLTYRIAHLIHSGIHPGQILALTFTNKAAREMKERIEKVVGSDARKVWAGTFHALFARILRVEAHKIGYPNDFTIYDTDDSKSVVAEIIKSLNLDKTVYNNSAVRSRISSAKTNLITPKAYVANEDLMALDRMNRRPMIYKIYEQYVSKCQRAGAMDFDDLLLLTFKLLYQNPEGVREKYQRQFKYVLVDEFQDTNYLQYEILKLLILFDQSPQNICIVGDDAQSIYSFRGATIENILQFEHDFPSLRIFKLEQNYRSTGYIVEAANQVITYNKRQIQKKIWTDNTGGQKIKVFKAMTESEEGRRVADTIIEQKNRFNLTNSQIAVLYRTNAQSRIFEEYLRRYNIAYRIYGGLSFYQRKEIKDLLAYMRLAINHKDDEALKRIINYPKRGIGKTTIDQLTDLANREEISMWEALDAMQFTPRSSRTVGSFTEMIRLCRIKAEEADAYEAVLFISKQSGIIDDLKADHSIEGLNRIENINSLLDAVKKFVEEDQVDEDSMVGYDRSLATFLQTISLMTDQDEESKETDYVTLMSVHSAKGLEFKSVFVVGLEENLFPSYMSMSTPDQIDEERRLFYVAITRAEHYLTLSYANSRYQYGQMRFNDPSRFLEEINDECIDPLSIIQKGSEKANDLLLEPKIIGNFKPVPRRLNMPVQGLEVKNFQPTSMNKIKEGMTVLHLQFGKGRVMKIDERYVATIHFGELQDNQEKRIMLQYAKLQVLEEPNH
ncbi:MAG TPA: UvrD-helicase domain-containing protein [Saprospiraceae bacterium]|nr:UvrD-helicase domain-containing protein [Saprospiraceae bacterium]